ncbi:MAG: CxxC-x17-CxxC domain-containing protein [Candidatus Omnitrophota bacterium]
MKKIIKRKNVAEPADLVMPEAQNDLTGLVNKMCDQLVSLEKKLDTLINRAPDRAAAAGGDRFERPGRFRPAGRSGGSRYDERPRETNFTQAVCSECGKECEIPFKPTGDRPVYCRDCFSARKDSAPSKGGFGDRPRTGGFSRHRSFDNRAPSRGSGFAKRRGSFSPRRKERS